MLKRKILAYRTYKIIIITKQIYIYINFTKKCYVKEVLKFQE